MAAVSSIIAGVGIAAGIGSTIYGAVSKSEAEKRQQDAIAEQNAIARQKLQFAQEQYADWQKRYGKVNQDLANYYSNLSATGFRQKMELANNAAANQTLKNFDTSLKNMQTTFAKQGMSNSGASAAAELQMQGNLLSAQASNNFTNEMNKLSADQMVADQKMNYAALGKQEQAMVNSMMEGSYNTQMDVAYQQQMAAMQKSQEANNWISSGIDTMFGAAGLFSGVGGGAKAAAGAAGAVAAPRPGPMTFGNATTYNVGVPGINSAVNAGANANWIGKNLSFNKLPENNIFNS